MRISRIVSLRHNLNLCCCLAFITLAISALALLAANWLAPGTSAHEKETMPPPQPAGRIFIVNTTNDGVDVAPGDGLCDTDINIPGEQCSLRAAIMEANASPGDDAIRFELPPSDAGCHLITGQCVIPFSPALPDITSNIEFDGPGTKVFQLLPSGVRAFRITTAATVSFFNLTINGGVAAGVGVGGNILNVNSATVNIVNCDIVQGHANAGGQIYNNSTGTVNVTSSRLTGGVANNIGGGGIYNNSTGTVNVTNSSIVFNRAGGTGNGGAILNNSTGPVNVSNCTITSNTAVSGGGLAGSAQVKSTIIAGNTGANPDVDGAFTSAGFNLIGKRDGGVGFTAATDQTGTVATPLDPHFGNNDTTGATPVFALLCSSPAIDKGTSASLTGPLTTDQRGTGFVRTVDDPSVANAAGGDGTDIGAFERQAPCNLNVQFTVNTTSDTDDVHTGDAVCDSDAAAGQQCSLRAALKELSVDAADGTVTAATINFAIPTSDPGFDPATGRFTITMSSALAGLATPSLQINGPGANMLKIENTGPSGIFSLNLPGMSVAISGLTLADARQSAISLQADSNLSVANCAFTGDIGTNGGAISQFMGNTNISNCTFSGNSASSSPQSSGGAVFVSAGNLNVTGSTFTANSSARGGAVSASGFSTVLTIVGSTFNGNIAGKGGAIEIESGASPVLNLIGSTISGNTATTGGGVNAEAGTANIINSTVFANTASGTNSLGGGVVASL
ncbi:MAG TPA: choice-of-anchor Q domain-containing protein, partial [Pyrinomonadaceae bacterium]|nr:choice-of-anchor Q domain-containing protein [Pyrinomonadaceae bacterium]